MGRNYRDADWLEEQYLGKGLTQREIAEECGVSPRTIRKYMKRFEIETREVKGENHGLYGKERSEEVKKRISEKLQEREFSEETREKISESLTGKTIPPQVREKISDSLKGIPKSKETRRRMRQAKQGEVEGWDHTHWMHAAYNRGFKTAKKVVHNRDEVCQVCRHDGSDRQLEVHHIVPVRMFKDVDMLEFEDAHCLGNLVLLCQSCHPKVEWGPIEIKPDFEAIPEDKHDLFRRLWDIYNDFHS